MVVEVGAWAVLGAAVGAPFGLVSGVLWAPFLASDGIRAALEDGPLGTWWGNYVAGFVVLGAVHVGVVAPLFAVFGSPGTVPDIIVGVPLLAGLVGALLLVRAMDGAEDVLRTYMVVMGGVLWYVLCTVILTLLVLVRFLPA